MRCRRCWGRWRNTSPCHASSCCRASGAAGALQRALAARFDPHLMVFAIAAEVDGLPPPLEHPSTDHVAAYVCTGTTVAACGFPTSLNCKRRSPNAPARKRAANRAQPHRGFRFGESPVDRSRTGWRKRPRALRRCISRREHNASRPGRALHRLRFAARGAGSGCAPSKRYEIDLRPESSSGAASESPPRP